MKMFRRDRPVVDRREEEIYAVYEIVYTFVDFAAALCFVVGSALFFYPAEQTPAIWLFVVGSVCFALKPTIRLVREFHLVMRGEIEPVAERYDA